MRIVFMGTPDFAVPSLRILVENGFDVVGVITATDKYGGRGNKRLIQSAVKQYALDQNLHILQPKNLKDPEFVEELRALDADLQVIVAFRMLPEVVWSMPKLGSINLHGSLLPKYRGAAPIHWAVANGERETGVTTFFLKHKIDTGDMLFQEELSIGENDTTGDVHDRMMDLGAETVLKTVQAIESNNYELKPQNDTAATKAPKVFHRDCEVNFDQDTEKVHNFIRGMSPFPAAWTMLEGKKLKLFRCHKAIESHSLQPGTFETDNRKYLHIATKDGFVCIKELQLQGKKRMRIKDFLNGYKFEQND